MENPSSVQELLAEVKAAFAEEPRLAEIFKTCYTNTLNTTVKEMEDGSTYVITGDIPAMWLRDSTAQLRPYLIPSNMFAVVVLGYLWEIARKIYGDMTLAEEAEQLREQVYDAIEKYTVVKTEEFGDIYAYELDGYGQFNLMDDANVPSLLSMKYLGYKSSREDVAENTRRFLLSEANPFY